MRKSKFTERQILAILGEGEAGVPVTEVSRKYLQYADMGCDCSLRLDYYYEEAVESDTFYEILY